MNRSGNALALWLLLLTALAGDAGSQAEPFRISVNVDLVVLHATVRDQKGRVVSDLRQPDFEVYEEGVRQSIRLFKHEDIPVTVGLVVDHSGSMREKLADVVAAARTFVRASSPEDEMFVVNFNEHVTLGLPGAIRFTNRPDELARAISNTPATGMTALYVGDAQEHVQSGNRAKKVLVVISDGGDNASAHKLVDVLKIGGQSSALVYTIGVFDATDPDRNPGVLRRLAAANGGEAFFPGQLDNIVTVCQQIAHDIRNQYTIGYMPTGAVKPGGYRSIRVVAKAIRYGKLSVRARAGYVAGETRGESVK